MRLGAHDLAPRKVPHRTMAQPRICPSCQEEYGADVDICPRDGRRLVTLAALEQRLVGQTLDGKYTLQSPLGRGGIGVVFRAWQHSMERPVAVKVLRRGLLEDETSVRRFLREVQGAGRVTHPNVVAAFDFGQTAEGELYLVMELLDGRTLGELLAAEGPLAPARAVALLAGICDGLHAAHEAGVVHRDVKPENVLVLPDTGPTGEFVKVVDFGLAQLKSVQGAESITKTGAICGTPAYMSPEQALDRPVDRRTDIYALGVVAWQLMVGTLPFTGDAPMRMLLAHLHEAPPPLALRAPWVPQALADVVMECLAKAPEDRPSTAAEVKRRLSAAMGTATGSRPDLSQPTLDGLPSPSQPPSVPTFAEATTASSLPVLAAVPAPAVRSPLAAEPVSETGLISTPSLTSLPAALERPRRWWLPVLVVLVAAGAAFAWWIQAGPKGAGDAGLAHPETAIPVAAADARPPPPDATVAALPHPEPDATAAPIADAGRGAPDASALVVDAAPPPPADAAVASVAPEPLVVMLHSRPEGAEVRLDGALLGTTPLALPPVPEGVARRVQLRLKAYEARTVQIDGRRASVQVSLRRLPRIVE